MYFTQHSMRCISPETPRNIDKNKLLEQLDSRISKALETCIELSGITDKKLHDPLIIRKLARTIQ